MKLSNRQTLFTLMTINQRLCYYPETEDINNNALKSQTQQTWQTPLFAPDLLLEMIRNSIARCFAALTTIFTSEPNGKGMETYPFPASKTEPPSGEGTPERIRFRSLRYDGDSMCCPSVVAQC